MRILQLKRIEDPKEPARTPVSTTNKLMVVKDQLRLLKDASIVAGAFDPEDVFELDLDIIRLSAQGFFTKLTTIEGEAPRTPDPVSLPQISQASSANYASAAEDGSDRTRHQNLDVSAWVRRTVVRMLRNCNYL
ncbi:hypothetical protein PI124_g21674 [Phytophthora idaei]|nr:hypothetical protein PI124_g21674 [Phytophthora idaei]